MTLTCCFNDLNMLSLCHSKIKDKTHVTFLANNLRQVLDTQILLQQLMLDYEYKNGYVVM